MFMFNNANNQPQNNTGSLFGNPGKIADNLAPPSFSNSTDLGKSTFFGSGAATNTVKLHKT